MEFTVRGLEIANKGFNALERVERLIGKEAYEGIVSGIRAINSVPRRFMLGDDEIQVIIFDREIGVESLLRAHNNGCVFEILAA